MEVGKVAGASDKTNLAVHEEYDEKKANRTKMLEEVTAAMTLIAPSQSKDEKQFKVQAMELAFGTSSWNAIERLVTEELEKGHKLIMDLKENTQIQMEDPNHPGIDYQERIGWLKDQIS